MTKKNNEVLLNKKNEPYKNVYTYENWLQGKVKFILGKAVLFEPNDREKIYEKSKVVIEQFVKEQLQVLINNINTKISKELVKNYNVDAQIHRWEQIYDKPIKQSDNIYAVICPKNSSPNEWIGKEVIDQKRQYMRNYISSGETGVYLSTPNFEACKEESPDHNRSKIRAIIDFKYYQYLKELQEKSNNQNKNKPDITPFKAQITNEQLKKLFTNLITIEPPYIDKETKEHNFLHVFGEPLTEGKKFEKVKWKHSIPLFLCLMFGFDDKKINGENESYNGIAKQTNNYYQTAINYFEFINPNTNNKTLSNENSKLTSKKFVHGLDALFTCLPK